jgi:hypothetical protein
MMGRRHVGGDLRVAVPLGALGVGRVGLDLELGIVRADEAYNLYRDWVDRQLYHLHAGASWAPGWKVAPVGGLGLEVYAPAALGARVDLGGRVSFAEVWRVEGGVNGGWLDQGGVWGAGIGLERGF